MSGLKRRFRPYFTAWAVVMWVALQGELSVGNVLAGLIVGLGVSLLLPLPAIPSGNICIHPGPLMVLLWYWLLGLIPRRLRGGLDLPAPGRPADHRHHHRADARGIRTHPRLRHHLV